MCAENARHNGIAGSVRASREGADMTMIIKLEYEYDHIDINKILPHIKEFEKNMRELDEKLVCRNFQIQSITEY